MLVGDSMLLLEEPELSLNDAIVSQIPLMIDRIGNDKRSTADRSSSRPTVRHFWAIRSTADQSCW